ncbi:MAG: hypothetical protein ACRD3L_06925 [Terriglobales bacterium]
MESQVANSHVSPGLDELGFQQMLEAAYVLQERRERAAPRPAIDPIDTLAEIAATQELLRSKDSDLRASAGLIAERLQKITSAIGVAVALIHEDQLEYAAAVGDVASLAGMTMPIDSSLSEFLQTAAADPALISHLLKRHNSRSPFWFPVYHEGKVAGLLDVRFIECDAIPAKDVQSCQVMAGLLGEAIARAAKVEWKQALATERATMLEVLELLRPQLERMAATPETTPAVKEKAAIPAPAAQSGPEGMSPEIEELLTAISRANESESSRSSCAQCGYQFGEKELFCGRCGTPRLMDAPGEQPEFAPEDLVVPKIRMEAGPRLPSEPPTPHPPEPLPPRFPDSTDSSSALALSSAVEAPTEVEFEIPEPKPESAQQSPQPVSPPTWTSASHALKWLQGLEKTNSPGRVWLAKHRGDVSIILAALVLLLALTGWGLHPKASAHQLTLFERMLVALGVAEAPPPPAATGNPNVWVWVDVHTALYYCPGADLYGKTDGGKFVLQHEAQLDQFQPAARKNCE